MEQNGRAEPDPDEAAMKGKEPDPDELSPHDLLDKAEWNTDRPQQVFTVKHEPDPDELRAEPDPDEAHIPMLTQDNIACLGNIHEPDPDEGLCTASSCEELDPNIALTSIHKDQEPDPDEGNESGREEFNFQGMDIDVVDDELTRIQNVTAGILSRLQRAITALKKQAEPPDTTVAIQTLFTILR